MTEDKLVFPEMENYYVTLKMIPDIYGYVKIISNVVKDQSNDVYQIIRTIEYNTSFLGIRDRMFAGLVSIYNRLFIELDQASEDGYQLQSGEFKNYFCVAIETANDIDKQILDFDMYLIQANTAEDLINNDKFKAIPNIKSDNICISLFNFGYQYENDFNKIDVENKIYSLRCYRKIDDGLRRYTLPNNELYDRTNLDHREFINNLYKDLDIANYVVGITCKEKN